jgi:hypothetical protein
MKNSRRGIKHEKDQDFCLPPHDGTLPLTSVPAMAKKNLAEFLVDTLVPAGVKRLYVDSDDLVRRRRTRDAHG